MCVLQEVTAAPAVRERSPHYRLGYVSNSCVCPSKTLLSHEKRSRYLSHAFSYAPNSYVRKKHTHMLKKSQQKLKRVWNHFVSCSFSSFILHSAFCEWFHHWYSAGLVQWRGQCLRYSPNKIKLVLLSMTSETRCPFTDPTCGVWSAVHSQSVRHLCVPWSPEAQPLPAEGGSNSSASSLVSYQHHEGH